MLLATGLLVTLLSALCLTLLVSVHRRNVAATVNTLVAVVLAFVSVAFAVGYLPRDGATISVELPLWVTAAGLLHSIGMLGPYDSVWWWDHLTHTVSAMLLAALVYAGFLVAAGEGTLALSQAGVAAATVAFVLVAGVFWELIELAARAVGKRYEIEPVLVHYGLRDTAFDLVFDFVGVVVVVALDVRLFVDVLAQFPAATEWLLVWTTSAISAGTVLLALALGVRRQRGVEAEQP